MAATREPKSRPRKRSPAREEPSQAVEAEVVAEPDEPEAVDEAIEPSEAELAEVEPEAAPPGKRPRALAPLRRGGGHDALQQYMNEVGRYPLLTREEERALAEKYQATGDL